MSERTFKVVIQRRTLAGSGEDGLLQRVATVYLEDGQELRVYAPPMAVGDSLEWIRQCSVHGRDDDAFSPASEVALDGAHKVFALKAVKEELERQKRDANRPVGMNPDGIYYDAYICLRGHVLSSGLITFNRSQYCQRCGSSILSDCQNCNTPLRGIRHNSEGHYRRPDFCHQCGHPFPWMSERLDTARDLLNHDDKLTFEERKELWNLLQYVMSDPKSDLVPAKKKLIDINLAKAAAVTREAVTDLLVKYLAEISKG